MALLQNKTIFITGAARGQGAAEARYFVEQGARVVICDVLDDQGQALADQLGERAMYINLDVTKESAWESAINDAVKHFGDFDVLVNNAGIYRTGKIDETTPELANVMYEVNQLGVLLGLKHGARVIKRKGGGVIINISSIAGLRGFANAIAYGGTKWAVRGMTKVAAAELAKDGIRVNSIHPGFIATDMLKENADEVNHRGAVEAPLGRHGTPEEIAHLAGFLASDQSSFITGAEVAIDGGWSI
ncbi:SDR family NAD(P)-dependent oxidoreductase [Pseudomonas pudica]|uniref:Glucose 1-dehydrogenase n=1 Tax=Pseudomonas pudica TaxID=272772 RepID=A0ABS0FUI8_9PSED|nr:glucose 1-dehydrogenase [Pseudomonas pudica]MBF8643989.1 glucose 1-dehydrogenase [Pseudomonas pudica]MBF8758644.1 glucose 1-dehydrogenase [Pseudomonas pudica]